MLRTAKEAVLAPLTDLQQRAAALLADGQPDECVAESLSVPLAWVQGLDESLPVAAAITRQQWRRYQGTRHRVRSLIEKALDTVEQEMVRRPTPELAVALLKALKLDPPAVVHQTAQQLLMEECTQRAEEELRKEASFGQFAFVTPTDVATVAADLFESNVRRLSAPADPEAA